MMRARTTLGIAAALAAALVCCSLATDFSGLEGTASPGDGGPNARADGAAIDATTSDATPDDDGGGAPIDATSDATPRTTCDPTAPFNPLVPLSEVNTSSDDTGARLTQDELTLYFASNRGGDLDLYRMTRATKGAKFGTIASIAELHTPHNERSASPDKDDLLLMFDSDQEGGTGGRDLYLATRVAPNGPYTSVQEEAVLNTSSDDSRCYLVPSALTVYFESDRSGGGDIYRASRMSGGLPFSAPSLLTELASSAEDGYPVVSNDQLVIYFASARSSTNLDIYRATRTSMASAFGAPVKVSELSSASDDVPTWLSPDLCRLYVMSDRSGGAGNYDIYVAARSP